jgi:hypothetical protein
MALRTNSAVSGKGCYEPKNRLLQPGYLNCNLKMYLEKSESLESASVSSLVECFR